MAEMSPGRDMQKFMKDRKKVGKDPELQLKGGISSQRNIDSKVRYSDQEKRASKVAKMFKGK
jgi:hypothetical protein